MTPRSASKEQIPELESISDTSECTGSETSEKEAVNHAPHASPKSVAFWTIAIREYDVIPGDNPSVSHGCPVSLGWDYSRELSVSVDDYEASKPQPREMTELRATAIERDSKLSSFGFTRTEIQEAAKGAKIGRLQRIKTIETARAVARYQELMEQANRKLFGGSRKREERELMKRSASLDSIAVNGYRPALRRVESLTIPALHEARMVSC